ncbi:solute carrier organic anion transporter family member 2B1 [Nerophis ophidion]|uniref:solute carrier organic anion transporter family member 2B1 n=1 Tax=Nerophis ophidion TaxID=159077 RepID=UPI002ADFB22D|nr:solute carrier organic anion transporter family member 2B1 [Nerophis ophidion]XP_061752921.1 solute carrier organic anion transporter family member 2B1 [Nerophis ophidion]
MEASEVKVSCERRAGARSPFASVKFFVLCHSLLQLAQLLVSGYMKSSISTIERRFGLSSQKSGLLAAFNEVGNTVLIVFVSFLGSRLHRPRFIGGGALLACLASLLMALPHFLSGHYQYGDDINAAGNNSGLCRPGSSLATPAPGQRCGEHDRPGEEGLYPLLLLAQLLLGIAAVPIQPFGISYIDDHASRRNSPLYLGVLLAVTSIGPAFGFLSGAFLLRFYVDFDTMTEDQIQLDRSDLRWVGAWWLGFLLASFLLFVTALPYFFFPRHMPLEDQSEADAKARSDPLQEVSLLHFLKSFPSIAVRTLLTPVYLLVVLAQVNLAAMVAGLVTFMAKFIEKQFSQTAVFSAMIIGGVCIPLAVLGTVAGGVVMRRWKLGVGAASKICATATLLGIGVALPLLFIGCPTQQVSGVFPPRSGALSCNASCQCPRDVFDPVCGSDGVEFTSPCHAGCLAVETNRSSSKVLNFTQCQCVGGASGSAEPGSCGSGCGHLLLPFVVLLALTGLVASLSQTPSFVIILRTVPAQDKSFAVGVQYMLFRVLAFMPGPVLYGTIIDYTCILWDRKCGRQTSCLYYDLEHFRHRFFGLQLVFMCGGLLCFILTAVVLHRRAGLRVPEAADKSVYELADGRKQEQVKVQT